MKQSLQRPILLLIALLSLREVAAAPWSVEKANEWSRALPWPVGCNFGPSSAINQLEMWQADTFDPVTIERELGWAEGLGFNSVRVFLHDLPWQADKDAFQERINRFLEIASKHHIRTMFVLFDAVWDPYPKSGQQRAPKPGVHNSGWVQSPGVEILKDPARQDGLRDYVQGVIGRFRDDRRVLAWDLFNEPDNLNRPAYVSLEPTNKAELAFGLLKKTFAWAREEAPSQPLTVGVWIGDWSDPAKFSAIERFAFAESDVITFHNYGKLEDMQRCVKNLRRFQRPLICTEYMARPRGSTFNPVLGYLHDENVGVFNWGFVAGKTQTIYPWDSWVKAYSEEPAVWFHDIFRKDGSAFDTNEVNYIRQTTGQKKSPDGNSRAATETQTKP